MRIELAYACGSFFTLDLEAWSAMPDGELRPCHVRRRPAGEAGCPGRRLLLLTYHRGDKGPRAANMRLSQPGA